jgi:hypothetical protein
MHAAESVPKQIIGGMTAPMGEPWVVQSLGPLGGDHVCWPFRAREELAVVAGRFVDRQHPRW